MLMAVIYKPVLVSRQVVLLHDAVREELRSTVGRGFWMRSFAKQFWVPIGEMAAEFYL
jgi:hypothetical protein